MQAELDAVLESDFHVESRGKESKGARQDGGGLASDCTGDDSAVAVTGGAMGDFVEGVADGVLGAGMEADVEDAEDAMGGRLEGRVDDSP